MHIQRTVLLALPFAALATAEAAPEAAPAPAITGRDPNSNPEKRQDFSALIELASLAGIPIPTTDPALLLSLGPLANELASDLPTAPVLSVLETAAPSGFLSNIVHDPAYAASFESQFAAGPSPSWFLALPSSVRDYLHTYNGIPSVVPEVVSAVGIISSATRTAGTVTVTGGETQSGGLVTGLSSGVVSTETTMQGTNTGSSGTMNGTGTASGSMTTSTTSVGLSAGTATGTGASSSSSTAGAAAARETRGALALGAVAAAGVLGLAIAL